ncbi:hypothetical protein [Demequina lignilytica]|uniref:Uncharacterized protein n=1 Tax=Demequina lignilytica TaxID=3051663 RepID=A0AB35MHH0_9MICO|nr:hypothetical protein [Demequina sp. SYSU T0a273]MDN4483182.1 hypothetical protein [Demequina sp. SYSU T0a273]
MTTYDNPDLRYVPSPDPNQAIAQAIAQLTYRRVNGHLPGRDEHRVHRTPRQRVLADRLRHAGQVSLDAVAARTRRWSDALADAGTHGTGTPSAA